MLDGRNSTTFAEFLHVLLILFLASLALTFLSELVGLT
jgi:hypothetical protein